MGTLVAEIDDRLALLSDPNTKWVQWHPKYGECCLVVDRGGLLTTYISDPLHDFLDELAGDYTGSSSTASAVRFNDGIAKNRQDVIDFLNVALDIAEDEGL